MGIVEGFVEERRERRKGQGLDRGGKAGPEGGGVMGGVGLALALNRSLESYLFGVSPSSPVVMIAVVLGPLLLVGNATLVPARWAARIDPAITLRSE